MRISIANAERRRRADIALMPSCSDWLWFMRRLQERIERLGTTTDAIRSKVIDDLRLWPGPRAGEKK